LQATHEKLTVEHAGAAAVVQSVPVRHDPQVPAAAPVVMQCGELAPRHGALAVAFPKLPLHATHTGAEVPASFDVAEHADVVPVHTPCSVAVHGSHVFVAVSHTSDVGQSASATQPPHWFVATSAGVHAPLPYAKPSPGLVMPIAPAVAP